MNKKKFIFAALSMLFLACQARETISINEGWGFAKRVIRPYGVYPNFMMPKTDTVVNLPHTWNAEDFMNDEGYYRGVGSYVKEFNFPESYKGKRVFLRFEGAGTVANVFVNNVAVGEHKGAYNLKSATIIQYTIKGRFMNR